MDFFDIIMGNIWLVFVIIWIIKKARKTQEDNNSTEKQRHFVKPENIYKTSSSSSSELDDGGKTTIESLDTAKELYKAGIISKEEYDEYRREHSKW